MTQILHLSDIHFGLLLDTQRKPGSSASVHKFVQNIDDPDPYALADILKRSLDNNFPEIVVTSGDIGWSGIANDYEYAFKFFESLRSDWKQTEFVFSPGNHDLRLDRGTDRHEHFIAFLRQFHGAKFEVYYPFLRSVADGVMQPSLLVAFHDISIPSEIPSNRERILVVAVNSAAHIKENGTPVYIDPEVLKRIERQIQKMKISADTLRIFVIHHHLLPFAEPEWRTVSKADSVPDKPDPTIVSNSAKLQAWLSEQSFQLVLHGHKHIPHGREDTLWRRTDPPGGRRLLMVGAGSAGVEDNHRPHQEPLSFNVISLGRLSKKQWYARIAVQQVFEEEAVPKAGELYEYSAELGIPLSGNPLIVHTEYMDDCHRLIRERAEGKGLLRNFISIVEQSDYRHPPTTRIGDRSVSQGEVESSFNTLHPEYQPSKKWTDFDRLDDTLRKLTPRFQFQHGPRLFGIPGNRVLVQSSQDRRTRPITRAIDNLGFAGKSHAYVGLFNPDLDVFCEQNEPLPGLMSLQFIVDEDDKYLDIVATFRKIELSFWWVVNMYEIAELLRWAVNYDRTKKRAAGRITFFAALAEWKDNPEAAFVTELDRVSIQYLTDLLFRLENGDMQAHSELHSLLVQKKEHTNENNLDPSGLDKLAQLIHAFLKNRKKKSKGAILSEALVAKLEVASEHIARGSSSGLKDRNSCVNKAQQALEEAASLVKVR